MALHEPINAFKCVYVLRKKERDFRLASPTNSQPSLDKLNVHPLRAINASQHPEHIDAFQYIYIIPHPGGFVKPLG
jgi:hypothetical protein